MTVVVYALNIAMFLWALPSVRSLLDPCRGTEAVAGHACSVNGSYVAGLRLSLVVIMWMGADILVVLTRAANLRRQTR